MLTRATDTLSSWVRFAVIFAVIVANGIFEETLILRAEGMMLLRWARDVVRYDVRWAVEEKVRLLTTRRNRSASEKREHPSTASDNENLTTEDAEDKRKKASSVVGRSGLGR